MIQPVMTVDRLGFSLYKHAIRVFQRMETKTAVCKAPNNSSLDLNTRSWPSAIQLSSLCKFLFGPPTLEIQKRRVLCKCSLCHLGVPQLRLFAEEKTMSLAEWVSIKGFSLEKRNHPKKNMLKFIDISKI